MTITEFNYLDKEDILVAHQQGFLQFGGTLFGFDESCVWMNHKLLIGVLNSILVFFKKQLCICIELQFLIALQMVIINCTLCQGHF